MPSLYTRRGDTGDSDVGGGRQRKDAPILEAVGAIDEANAAVGAAVTELEQGSQKESPEALHWWREVTGACEGEAAGFAARKVVENPSTRLAGAFFATFSPLGASPTPSICCW